MTLVAFIVLAWGGAAVWGILGRWPMARTGVGLAALAGCLFVAYGLPHGGVVEFGDEALQPTGFLRLWLGSASAAALLLALVALVLGRPARLAPAALVMLGGTAAALSVTDSAAALLLVVAMTTLVGLLATGDRDAALGPVRIEGLRVAVAVAVLALLGMAWATSGGLTLQPLTVLAAFTLVGAALVLGTGTIPVHLPLVRQAETMARPLVPLAVGWLPAALALVLIGWSDVRLVPASADGAPIATVLVLLGLLTLVAAGVAMCLQDDLGHLVTYAAVQGLAVGVLAYASLDDQALPAARVALLLLPLWLAALIGATLVVDRVAGTARIPALAGWIRRTPLTALAMAVAVSIAVGAPGLIVFDARRTILDLAAGPVLGPLGLLAGAISLIAWGRLAWVGLRPAVEADAAHAAGRAKASVPSVLAERPTRGTPPVGARDAPATARALLATNRIPIAAVLVMIMALLPLGLSLGAGHLDALSQGPIPAASERPTPTPGPTTSPTETPPATATATPASTVTPGATSSSSVPPSGVPSSSPGPSPSPGSSTGD
ncbi:MAG: hypothetical protein ACHQZR_05725 [Candidatus Limnocylindrales bacterium]